MNERLTIQDLTDLLANKHSMSKKDAEAFVKEFFLLIEQALESEKTVKIKGLGTFKLIEVDSRESVNVNTGERFQIKGHTKVSFSPDTSLRDTINKPFAHFETVVLNENTILDDTPIEDTEEEETTEETPVQTEVTANVEISTLNERTDIQEEQITEPVATTEAEESSITETVIEEEIAEEQYEVEEQVIAETIDDKIEALEDEEAPVANQQPEEPLKEEKEEITAEKIIEQELQRVNLRPEAPITPLEAGVAKSFVGSSVAGPEKKKEESGKEKSPVPYLIAIIVLVLLLCGGAVLFIYYPDMFSPSPAKNTLDMPMTAQPVQPETLLSDTLERKDSVVKVTPDVAKVVAKPQSVTHKEEVKASAKTENKAVQQPSAPVYLDSASYKITGTKTKYTIKEGETLTRVSLRFFGTKAMWPYIVKHNPDVIKNPNNVPYGTTVKIPELTKE